ncbi:hypothetical protein [Vreelandella venusta]|uniref:hypothetical protein n=1 Tax=Vreelandella venusta TaxID=44935 RepID=UPI0018DA8D4D|nr:hypothetical protein [Halomonas venusta]QPI62439.1 hypothetical protein IR195_11070 [Halomonas venusta]UQI42757.1 hypothetical protein M3L73_11025 [Halomonas venusta]
MSFRIDKFDASKFTDGEWCEIMGGEFKIARMHNSVYRDVKRKLDKRYRKDHGDELTAEQEDRKEAQLVAEGLIRDWRNVTALNEDGDEVPVPYSIEAVADLLQNRPDVVPFIAQKAVDLERFDRIEAEEQAKKPRASSAGKASSAAKAKAS